jgi:hypothetical protein
MTHRPRKAFTIVHALLWVTLLGTVTSLGMYEAGRSLVIQRRIASWANDDAVAQDILRRIRKDLAVTREAAADRAGGVLTLSQSKTEVRYQISGNLVERVIRDAKGPSRRTEWRFSRSSMQWRIEQGGAGAVVWIGVEIRDPVHKDHPLKQRYACGIRVGSAAAGEDRP